jgi:hypothetical protein
MAWLTSTTRRPPSRCIRTSRIVAIDRGPRTRMTARPVGPNTSRRIRTRTKRDVIGAVALVVDQTPASRADRSALAVRLSSVREATADVCGVVVRFS